MESRAIIYPDPTAPDAHERLGEFFREAGFTVELRSANLDPDAISKSLPNEAFVLVIPLIEQDCLGVKIMQVAALSDPVHDSPETHRRHITLLYGRALPGPGYLSLAYREGADDIIAMQEDESQINNQVRRAYNRLRALRRDTDILRSDTREAQRLAARCEQLEKESSRSREQIHLLARTAAALAIGDFRPEHTEPALLVVSCTEALSKIATQCAEQLHYRTRVARSAAQAMQLIAEQPADVILSEVQLPDADAPKLAQQIRRASPEKLPYFIAWSSDIDAENRLLGADTCIDDFVLKRSDAEATLLLTAALLRGMAP